MSTAKYSPTVSSAYNHDQKWFYKNGGDFGNGKNPDSYYDNDGFDLYGYNEHGNDRAGYSEEEYSSAYSKEGDYEIYFDVESDWSFDGVKPVRRY